MKSHTNVICVILKVSVSQDFKNTLSFQYMIGIFKILYQQSLNKHISRVHIKSNDFKCPLCEHTTTDKDYLRTHIRTHEAEEDSTKKWLCEICSKRFWDRCKLRNEAYEL